MRTKIKDMVAGQKFYQVFNLIACERAVTSKGSAYMKLTLGDSSGTIKANAWFDSPTLIEGAVRAELTTQTYNGELQGVVGTIINIEPTMDELEDIVPVAPTNPVELEQGIREYLKSISDADIKAVAVKAIGDRWSILKRLPAAKAMHHNYIYGWMQHTFEMLRIADAVAQIFPVINRDYLIAGTALHDIGKSAEFSCSSLGIVDKYSVSGSMEGHLFIGARIVEDVSRELNIPEEKMRILTHMILSHHGNPEWGAVARPCTPEAQALFLIDMMSARLEMYRVEYENLESGQMSDIPTKGLDGVRVYKI